MFYDDDWAYGWKVKNQVSNTLAKIHQLEKLQGGISKAQKQELDRLHEELKELRGKCRHVWRVELVFVRYREFCDECGIENRSYDHFKHGR